MPVHSRPHLSTHNRDKGHSAVGAAAYRLGLRLFDRRAEKWHDYTKRAVNEEVVAAFTVAPANAPDWVNDPDELWNRVELAEKRKDAQVARDYVVPIPLGLQDPQARELAQRLARYICDQLGTPVSVGVHRDADVDLFGNLKPASKQGYHAHLLFPTRVLVLPGTTGMSDEEADQGFGIKLSALSNRRTSSGIVELMNKEWAALANELTAQAGLTADYDHRSYERLGIDRIPRPRMTANALAMERKGFFTRQGDRVRDILATTEVYKQTHTSVLTDQHAQALEDIVREAVSAPDAVTTVPLAPPSVAEAAPFVDDNNEPASVAQDLAAARERGQLPKAALADRFVAQAPVPNDEPARRHLFTLSGLVWAIHRSLTALAHIAERLVEHRQGLRRWRHAQLDGLDRFDEVQAWRAKMDRRAEAWSRKHQMKILLSNVKWGPHRGKPEELRRLEQEMDRARVRVVEEQEAVERMKQTLAFEESVENDLMAKDAKVVNRLDQALREFVALDAGAVSTLKAVLPAASKQTVEAMLGEVMGEQKPAVAVPMDPPALRLAPPRSRPGP